jgi:hypothetical protein
MIPTTFATLIRFWKALNGGRLVAAAVLEDQLDRAAVHAAVLVEIVFGDLRAEHLLLSGEGHGTGLRHGDADRDRRIGGEGCDRGAQQGNREKHEKVNDTRALHGTLPGAEWRVV